MPSTKMADGRRLDTKLIDFLAMMAQNPDLPAAIRDQATYVTIFVR